MLLNTRAFCEFAHNFQSIFCIVSVFPPMFLRRCFSSMFFVDVFSSMFFRRSFYIDVFSSMFFHRCFLTSIFFTDVLLLKLDSMFDCRGFSDRHFVYDQSACNPPHSMSHSGIKLLYIPSCTPYMQTI